MASTTRPHKPRSAATKEPLLRDIFPKHHFYVEMARNDLRNIGRDPNKMADRLHKAISKPYLQWVKDEFGWMVDSGELADDMSRPYDVVEYVLGYELTTGFKNNLPLRDLVSELSESNDPMPFFALLVVYANRIGDPSALKRAFRIATTPDSPYWTAIRDFKSRLDGTKEAAEKKNATYLPKYEKIMQREAEMLADRVPGHQINKRLAREFDKSPQRIGQIRKMMKAS